MDNLCLRAFHIDSLEHSLVSVAGVEIHAINFDVTGFLFFIFISMVVSSLYIYLVIMCVHLCGDVCLGVLGNWFWTTLGNSLILYSLIMFTDTRI